MKHDNRGLEGSLNLMAATAEAEVLRRQVLDAIERGDFISALDCWGSWSAYDDEVVHLPQDQLGLEDFEEAAGKLSDFAHELLETAAEIRGWVAQKRKPS